MTDELTDEELQWFIEHYLHTEVGDLYLQMLLNFPTSPPGDVQFYGKGVMEYAAEQFRKKHDRDHS